MGVHLARRQLQHFLSCRRITFAFSFSASQNNRDARERRDVRICHSADVLTRVRNRILLPAHADFNCGGKKERGGGDPVREARVIRLSPRLNAATRQPSRIFFFLLPAVQFPALRSDTRPFLFFALPSPK